MLKRVWAQVESRVGRCLLLWAPSSLGSFGGTDLKTRRHLETRRSTVLPDHPPPPLLTVTASPFSPSPAPASWGTPMPSRTPELGQVPVRQADITDGHGQTQKKPGTVGPAQPPAPLGCMEVELIPAGSRQLADAKIPRNLMKAMHLVLPSPLWQQETLNLSCPQALSEPPQLGSSTTAHSPGCSQGCWFHSGSSIQPETLWNQRVRGPPDHLL